MKITVRARGSRPDQLVDPQRLDRLQLDGLLDRRRSSATSCATASRWSGYGFNSNGRYSAGEILRRRVIPRLLDAEPEALLDRGRRAWTRARAWDFMMRNEKPGGHGERSVAVGVVDMALFDLAAKIAGQPLYRYLSDRYGDGQPDDSVFVYAAGGYYAPGKGLRDLQDEMRGFLDQGYHVVKMKIGGADLAEDLRRIEAVLEVLDGDGSRLAVDVNGRFDLATALEYGKAIEPYGLFWYEEVGDPLDYALNATLCEHYSGRDRDRGEPVLPAGRPQPDPLRRHAPGPRHHPGRPRPELRADRVPADPGHARASTAGPRGAASRTAGTSSPCTSPPH